MSDEEQVRIQAFVSTGVVAEIDRWAGVMSCSRNAMVKMILELASADDAWVAESIKDAYAAKVASRGRKGGSNASK